jgi:hypothetical protein
MAVRARSASLGRLKALLLCASTVGERDVWKSCEHLALFVFALCTDMHVISLVYVCISIYEYLYEPGPIHARTKVVQSKVSQRTTVWLIVRKIENETFVDLETVCKALLRHQQRFCGVGRGEWTWPPGLRGLPWFEKCRYLLHRAARACPGAADCSKWPVGMLVGIMVDAISELQGPDVVCNTSDSH